MRELYYENQGTNTYLVYEIGEQDVVDSMSLGMLTNNRIHGLAQTLFTQMDSKKYFKYNVSAKVSVAQFYVGAVNKKRLLGVFSGIVNAMLSAEDYMLNLSSILLDLDYIFTDVSTCETDLICLPILDTELPQLDLGLFFRNIMFNTQFDQTENCDHVAKIINYLNGTPLFSLSDFKKLLEEIQGHKVQPIVTKISNEQTSASQTTQQNMVQPVVTQMPSTQGQKGTFPPVSSNRDVTVPPSQGKKISVSQETPQATEPEISFLYLMQHYNKENAAAYKAQKAAKKKAAASKGQSLAQQSVEKKAQPAMQPTNDFGFAVPGQATPVSSVPTQPATQSNGNQTPAFTTPVQQPAYVPLQVPQGQAANFGETTVLGGGAIGETTVLDATNTPAQIITPHLIRKKNNEKISLNKPVFRVGKERSYVDYFIGDNTAISRSHANFITRNGEYFVVDTNSTNHTFVNGSMIQSNIETKISQGDAIRLANEDFEFKLY